MSKVPNKMDKSHYIGVELEFYALAQRDIVNTFRNHGIARFAEIGRDGSIRAPDTGNYQTAEVRVLCKYTELTDVMATLQDYLNKVKAKVNASCGLHVHLDMRNMEAHKAYANLMARQDEMFKSISSKRRTSQYCQKVGDTKAAKIIAALSGKKISKQDVQSAMRDMLNSLGAPALLDTFDVNRLAERIVDSQSQPSGTHHWDGISANPILTNKYLTLEVRMHEATTNTNSIRRWVRYLYEVAFNGEIGTLSKKYIEERIAKHG